MLITTEDIVLCRSMTPVIREKKAQEIGLRIKVHLLKDDLDNMEKLERLQHTLQDKEELYLLKKHKSSHFVETVYS